MIAWLKLGRAMAFTSAQIIGARDGSSSMSWRTRRNMSGWEVLRRFCSNICRSASASDILLHHWNKKPSELSFKCAGETSEQSQRRPDMHIVRAVPDDAATLTRIAVSSKRYWGYPERWIENWRTLLTISPEFILTHETYKAVAHNDPVGFYALSSQDGRLRLEHLWVLPDAMRQGIGRSLFAHALERAKALEFRSLDIESDPNAAGFYERMGATRVGTKITEIEGQSRELPVLVCRFDPVA